MGAVVVVGLVCGLVCTSLDLWERAGKFTECLETGEPLGVRLMPRRPQPKRVRITTAWDIGVMPKRKRQGEPARSSDGQADDAPRTRSWVEPIGEPTTESVEEAPQVAPKEERSEDKPDEMGGEEPASSAYVPSPAPDNEDPQNWILTEYRAMVSPELDSPESLQNFFKEMHVAIGWAQKDVPNAEERWEQIQAEMINLSEDAAVEHPEVKIGVCVNSMQRLGQLSKTLPLNMAWAMPHLHQARFYVAVGEDDDETIEWLYDVLEFWIRLRYVVVYKNTLAYWHDAEWKNALHRAAIDDGATVVTEAGELAPRMMNAPAPPSPHPCPPQRPSKNRPVDR